MGQSTHGPHEYVAYLQQSNCKLHACDDYKWYAAVIIQKNWKGFCLRRRFKKLVSELQYYRAAPVEPVSAASTSSSDVAATKIQGAWRSYNDRRIYQYYRDLIAFRQQGDPKELLRSINPREAGLVDAASGLHVRLRLGGTTFPPLIFYKIFTHRPVTDICAFCPRNYAKELYTAPASQQAAAKTGAVHSAARTSPARDKDPFVLDEKLRRYTRRDGTTGYRSQHGWYERFENNGWRPIVDRALVDEEPSASGSQSRHLEPFHHQPAVRKEERLRKQKLRKREWLMKLYSGAALDAEQVAARHEEGGNESGMEDLDLLEWSSHLDFDAYLQDWTALACTMASDAFVPDLTGPAQLFGRELEDAPAGTAVCM